MRIVYLIHGLYNSGGMERVLSCKANFLTKQYGHEVHIITRNQMGREFFFPLEKNVVVHDLELNYSGVTGRSPLTVLKNFKFLYRHYIFLRNLLINIKPDITISMYGNELTFLPYIKDGSKKILEYHFSKYAKTIGKNKNISPIYQRIRFSVLKYFIKKYNMFVTLTERDRLSWGIMENSIAIPNPLTFDYITSSNTLESVTAVSAGRLEYQKGYDRLIEAWKKIHEKFPNWKLKIYGDGSLRKQLQNQIIESKLEDSIILSPTVKNLAEEYQKAAFFISSSRFEGFPLVFAEAMACGLPIISFDYPCGPSEIIENGVDGLLVEEGNIKELTRAITTLIENPYIRVEMSSQTIHKAQKYNLENIMNLWNNIFQDVLNK